MTNRFDFRLPGAAPTSAHGQWRGRCSAEFSSYIYKLTDKLYNLLIMRCFLIVSTGTHATTIVYTAVEYTLTGIAHIVTPVLIRWLVNPDFLSHAKARRLPADGGE